MTIDQDRCRATHSPQQSHVDTIPPLPPRQTPVAARYGLFMPCPSVQASRPRSRFRRRLHRFIGLAVPRPGLPDTTCSVSRMHEPPRGDGIAQGPLHRCVVLRRHWFNHKHPLYALDRITG